MVFSACSSSGRKGLLTDASGEALASQAVRLIVVNDAGEEISLLASTFTDANGSFSFEATTEDPGASFIVEAFLTTGTYRAFLAGSSSQIPVSPLTTALVSLVIDITSTSGGRSLSDFSAEELRSILDEALEEDDLASLNLSDTDAVLTFLRTNVGRTIALASGGSITGQSTEALESDLTSETATFSTDSELCNGANHVLFQGSDFRFPVEADGTLCPETHLSLSPMLNNSAFQLILTGESYFVAGGLGGVPYGYRKRGN